MHEFWKSIAAIVAFALLVVGGLAWLYVDSRRDPINRLDASAIHVL